MKEKYGSYSTLKTRIHMNKESPLRNKVLPEYHNTFITIFSLYYQSITIKWGTNPDILKKAVKTFK